jgi:Mce-associated membrane protein
MSKHSQEDLKEVAVPTDTDTDTEQADETPTQESGEKVDEDTIDDENLADATESDNESTDESTDGAEPETPKHAIQWARVVAYGVLPALVLLLAMGAGYLKWQDNSARVDNINDNNSPAHQAMQTAKDSTIALLSYKPDTVEQQLTAARDLLTSDFRDQYTSLTNDVVIPGAKQKQISAVATVPATALVSADPRHAVVLVFVNQTVIVGQSAPTDTASSVRVTLDKTGDRWLIAKFDPV